MPFYRKNRRPVPEEEKCADPAKARVRALDALAAREMTSTQLYERLCSRFTEQAAAAAVADMVELDYVNDDRYAEARAHGLLMARKSRRAAAQDLREGAEQRTDRAGAGKRLCTGRGRRKPRAGSCRRAGGKPLPQKAGRWAAGPRGGGPAAPGVCISRHQGSHPQGGGRVIEREYHPL